MSDEKPPFLTENGRPVGTHYTDRFCPILSAATLTIVPSPIVSAQGVQGAQPHLSSCRGIKCMKFMPEVDQAGQIVNGACSDTVTAGNMGQISQLLLHILESRQSKH